MYTKLYNLSKIRTGKGTNESGSTETKKGDTM